MRPASIEPLSTVERDAIATLIAARGEIAAAAALGVARGTMHRLLDGSGVHRGSVAIVRLRLAALAAETASEAA